jgi:predicted XRE-type DNA-binding protein
MNMAHAQRQTGIEDEDLTVHRGSGDFLADRGIKDPDEFRVMAHLCREIATIIESRDLTQEQAALVTGLKQPDISRIVNSRFQDLSVWKLLKVLSALGADVMIAVHPNGGEERGIIASQTVEAAPEETVSYGMSP